MKHRKFFAYRSFWPELETVGKFHRIGVNTVTVFASNSVNSLGEPYSKYPPHWRWFGNYDFSIVERQFHDLLSANPEAEFIVMIDLNSPLWLQRQLAGANGDSFTNLTEALTHPVWRRETQAYLTAITDYYERHWSDRIVAYVLACGYTDEWMDYGRGGAGADKVSHYRDACTARGETVPADVPGIAAREHITHGTMLRDPATDAEALRYWRYTADTIVDGIEDFAGQLRRRIRPDVEIGVFYGYILELGYTRLVQSGHLAYERLLQGDAIDFLISPGTYSARGMGDGGGFMIPDATIRRYGKTYLHECDQRTHCFNPDLSDAVKLDFVHWQDEAEDLAGLKYEMGLSLVKHTSLWWFDMWGGYYRSDAVFALLRRMRELWERFAGDESPDRAEIALVVDPDSTYYLNDTDERYEMIHYGLRNLLGRLGAPFSVFSFNDVETEEFARCKVAIFPFLPVVTRAKSRLLERHVCRDGRTVLWVGDAGVIDESGYDPTHTRELCGETPPFPRRACRGDWHSARIAVWDEASVAALRTFCAAAGVRLWAEAGMPVAANRDLAVIHTAVGGAVPLHFPADVSRVTELYTGREIEIRDGVAEYTFAAPDTVLFRLHTRA